MFATEHSLELLPASVNVMTNRTDTVNVRLLHRPANRKHLICKSTLPNLCTNSGGSLHVCDCDPANSVLNIKFMVPCIVIIFQYTGCNRRKGQNFGRVFLMLKYTDITQNTYIQSWTVTEIMAREKCGLLACLRTVPCQLTAYRLSVPGCRVRLQKYRWRTYVINLLWLTACHV